MPMLIRLAALALAGFLFVILARAEPKPEPKKLTQDQITQMVLIQKDSETLKLRAENLQLAVCAEAQLKPTECQIDWQAGTVAKKADPKAEPKK